MNKKILSEAINHAFCTPKTFDNLTMIKGSNKKPVIPPRADIEIAFPRSLPK